MNAGRIQFLVEHRIGVVIHTTVFLVGTVIVLLSNEPHSDGKDFLQYAICLITVGLVVLVMHYFAPSLYHWLNPADYATVQHLPYQSRHRQRDIHAGFFLGVNNIAWSSLVAAGWVTRSNISGLLYGAFAWGWGCFVPIWAVAFLLHISLVAVTDNRQIRREML
jgi:hypothetical protein